MTALAGMSRATYYRFDSDTAPAVRDTELRDAIQRIALRFPAYGRPRITAELKRQGWTANHKRVGRILREDNLLCLRKKKFHATTDSKHGFPVFPNLTRNFVPTARNELWVADITYIRLAEEFVYLAVVLDAYSRLVIGWALERTLEAKLAIGALQMALDKRAPAAGVIHHSDRGVQYACGDYTQVLKDHGFKISMSRKANPYDNAKAESFMKTLKHEEVNRVE
jgi:putative transposase